ncbi:HNH endonuclease family protein [Tsukamurella soli]|uniref:HNH endonuclease family protein n=1 Tax=Tsukamurella soli TaxID=644556 RepID=UPI0031EE8FFA
MRAWAALLVAVLTAVSVACSAVGDRRAEQAGATGAVSTAGAPPGRATVAAAGDPLAGIRIVAARAKAPVRYRRAAFGEAWTDDSGAALGHNGCDTRNDILDRDLTDKTYVHVHSCPRAVATGTLIDPYTGQTMHFVRGPKTSAKVQIDHIVPLAYAWDMGAYAWDDAKRTRLANDPRNLVAVDGPSNDNKKDSPPGRWMPSNEGFHCQYVEQFAGISREYGLSVDAGSAAVIRQVESVCRG